MISPGTDGQECLPAIWDNLCLLTECQSSDTRPAGDRFSGIMLAKRERGRFGWNLWRCASTQTIQVFWRTIFGEAGSTPRSSQLGKSAGHCNSISTSAWALVSITHLRNNCCKSRTFQIDPEMAMVLAVRHRRKEKIIAATSVVLEVLELSRRVDRQGNRTRKGARSKGNSFTEWRELIYSMDWRETGRWEEVTQGKHYVVGTRPASYYGAEYLHQWEHISMWQVLWAR